MQLTGLEIYGFKSFADKTRFIFDKGITGVVGPNGCGKSNIVDAIRWVLGEQSAKYLRSDKMENVIFNGTDMRRKANFAEVSLTFENTKNVLPTEYTTVTITRKLYRSGESEYLLNNVQCRLKDITSLFMDTGIASDSYSIIELKMVEEILTNKDQERRRFFEEAAGISKYKLRKKQTLKKLEETDGDLTRVEDLLSEIEKNLKSLERQAKRAQKYFELKAEYKKISAQYAYLKLKNVKSRQAELEAKAKTLNDMLTQIVADTAQREARLSELRKQLIDKEQLLSASQITLNNHVQVLQASEAEKNVKNERLRYLRQREFALMNQIDTEQKQWEKLTRETEALEKDKTEKQNLLSQQETLESELKKKAELSAEKLQAAQKNSRNQEAEHKETDNELRQLIREKEMQAVRMKSLESELARQEEDKYVREDALDEFAEKSTTLQREITDLEILLQELQSRKQKHEEDIKNTEYQHNTIKDVLYQTQRALDAREHDYKLTKSLVENLEGFPDSVKFLKKNAIWIKDAPLLSDIFTARDEYKIAIEQFLEPYLSYYVVDDRNEAIEAIELLAQAAKGRANFFILSALKNIPQAEPEFSKGIKALSLVEVSSRYQDLARFLLQNVYIISEESDMPESVPPGIIVLQQNGKQIRRASVFGGGSVGLFEGKRLGRAKNLALLEKEFVTLRKTVDEQKKQLLTISHEWDALKKVKIQQEIEPVNRKLIEKQKDIQLLATREKEHREFLVRVGQRTEILSQELNTLKSNALAIEPTIQEVQVALNRITRELYEARDELSQVQSESGKLTAEYNQAHIKLIHQKNQYQNLLEEISRKKSQIAHNEKHIAQMKEEHKGVVTDTENLIQINHREDTEILEMYEKKKTLESETDKKAQQVGETRNFIRQQEEAIDAERKKRESVIQQELILKDELTEFKLQFNALRERMSVEFQIEVETITESVFEGNISDYTLEKVEISLNTIRQQVQSYGEINPMALEAFQEMQERYNFIKIQADDLYKSRQILLKTIAEIDETAKEKFMETFISVRTHFISVFRSLFTENDTCDLILTDPDNPLESEIDIIARPKGKRPLTIAQLSGGEKTLTAVALLFAIYLIKPAPFCVFDEVDAPLDDANIDKFNNIIRDFSRDSQFIIVTHNKRTMAATNVMYGITMEDAGVSRMLPVSLEALNING